MVMPEAVLNGQHADPDFIQSKEVLTEYERGVRDGEALARDVMEWTANIERLNIDMRIENTWLRYQRNSMAIVAVCFLIAFIAAFLR